MKTIEEYYTEAKPTTKIRIAFGLLALVFTLILVAYGLGYNANKNRIDEIQQSRVESCQQTYAAFPEAFAPFFPSGQIPAEQQERINAFNKNIENLIEGCKNQVDH